ncbi:MAG: hypothetical protein IPK67_13375 [Planctomycetes bacterium]|nr:hypothetical protein [Planctomycetota bacterium]
MAPPQSERIDPLFFGPRERPLFGCHHGPASGAPSALGVVLAPPLGHEHARAHRALRRLAQRLAEQGMRALRFDFRGTGDSAGDRWPLSLAEWCEDLELAQRELLLRARVPRCAVFGVRLSATLALESAARGRAPDSLVLWDPVLNGAEFTRELEALEARFEAGLPSRPTPKTEAEGRDGLECLGFLWPRPLLEQLQGWPVPDFQRPPAARVLLLEAELSQAATDLAARLRALGSQVAHERTEGARPWNEDIDRGLVPAADLERMVQFLGSAT